MISISHLLWIPAGAIAGFLVSYVLGDMLELPVDLYYAIYFAVILDFLVFYSVKTRLDLKPLFSKNLFWGITAGTLFGILLMLNVFSRPETAHLSGPMLLWAVFWRGLIYGTVDGLLLFTFPWVVAWRAFNAKNSRLPGKVAAVLVSYAGILIVTTAYHAGYADFRSEKIIQPNIGATISSAPTLLTANPVASPLSHIFLHVAAVLHSPYTDLYLPPHQDQNAGPEMNY